MYCGDLLDAGDKAIQEKKKKRNLQSALTGRLVNPVRSKPGPERVPGRIEVCLAKHF
jgi:hypothetical protein